MIFLDTGSFIARYIEQDSYHAAAVRLWEQIGRSSLFTSNHVLDETLTLLARRAGYRFAGPAIVTEYSATTVVPPGWRARVDAFENLVLTRLR